MTIIFVSKYIKLFSIIFSFVITAAVANPLVPPGELIDSRIKPPFSFVGGGLRAGAANFLQPYVISWDISDQGSGVFRYEYSFSSLLWNGFFLQSTSGMSASDVTNLTINTGLLSGIGNIAEDRTFGSVDGILFRKNILINLPITSLSFEINAFPEYGSFRHGLFIGGEIPNIFVRNFAYGSPIVFNTNNYVAVVGAKTPDIPTYLGVITLVGVGVFFGYMRRTRMKETNSR